jgi:hypothetical protein
MIVVSATNHMPDFYRFHNVMKAPSGPGVYAWYYKPCLAEADIQKATSEIAKASPKERLHLVKEFLNKYVFGSFAEMPYDVQITGQLKPKYEGKVGHVPQISESLLQRISNEPSRLEVLAKVLSKSMPNFLSPIYIGSALILRKRLEDHCKLIRKYRDGALLYDHDLRSRLDESSCRDHSFAHEVAITRRFDPNNLWVYVLEIDDGETNAIDLENVLNRISFPLCGRN